MNILIIHFGLLIFKFRLNPKNNYVSKGLIEVYTILNSLEKINPDSLFTRFRYNKTRCHTMKLEKKHVHLDIRKYFLESD